MKKKTVVLIAVTGLSVWAWSAFSQMGNGMMGSGRGGMMGRGGGGMMMGPNAFMNRHRDAMHQGIPSAYAKLKNPLSQDEQTLQEGGELFKLYCATCHGEKGAGDGPAGAALNPKPAYLRGLGQSAIGSDAFIYWTIAEGGTPYQTAMPPFKEALKPEEIWKIVWFVKNL